MIIENFDDEKKRTSDKSRCSPTYVIIPFPTYSNQILEQECHVQILKTG